MGCGPFHLRPSVSSAVLIQKPEMLAAPEPIIHAERIAKESQ
jgi:hypothetical protein